MAAEICSARAGSLGNVFAEYVHFLFSRIREYCIENFFSFNLSISLFLRVVCWRLKCSLYYKQEIISTKMRKFFSTFSEMACDKNQTYLQVW
jgi:hypothetical protein